PGHGVSLLRTDCIDAESLKRYPEHIIVVVWTPSESSVLLVHFPVEALAQPGLLSDITRALTEQHVNILAASVQTSRDRVAMSRFTFEMADPSHLASVIRAVRRVSGVLDAYRVTGTAAKDESKRHRTA